MQQNLPTDTLNQKGMKALMEKASDKVRTVLELRNQLAMASVKKYEAMLNSACSDGRIRGMFQFYGAIRDWPLFWPYRSAPESPQEQNARF